jgi:hypothetical protein
MFAGKKKDDYQILAAKLEGRWADEPGRWAGEAVCQKNVKFWAKKWNSS